jgi:hypothetical protein
VVTRSLAMATRHVSGNPSNWLVCYDIRRYLWGRFVRRVVLPIESVFLDRGHVEANGVIWNARCHRRSGIWCRFVSGDGPGVAVIRAAQAVSNSLAGAPASAQSVSERLASAVCPVTLNGA